MKKSSTSFWLVGYLLMMLMVGANLPSPLYGVYQHEWGFSSGILTLVFAVYALMIVPALLLFGQLADRFGRKKILIPGLIVAALASVLFAVANDVTWLFIARAIQGLAVGIVSGAATAALAELHPRGDRKHAALIASVATAGGTAIGPILAEALAQYGPWPTVFPFIVQLILLLPGILALLFVPETIPSMPAGRWKPQRPSVPSEIRTPFTIGAATAFTAWAVTALFMSLVPSYVGTLLHVHNLAITGGVVFVMLGSSSVVQLSLKSLAIRVSHIAGLILLIVGLAGVVLAVPAQSIILLIVSTIVTGAGQGLAFMGSMALIGQVAPPERRGDVISSFYVVIYCGVGIPILGVGFGAESFGLYHAVLAFACAVAVLGLLLVSIISARRNLMLVPQAR